MSRLERLLSGFVRNRSDRWSAGSLSNPPPLPDAEYRARLRLALLKFQRRADCGWLTIAKREIVKSATQEEANDPANAHLLDPEWLKRKLYRWCSETERGDVDDAKFLFFIERFLRQRAPRIMEGFQSQTSIIQEGRAIAEFLKRSPATREWRSSDQELVTRSIPLSPGIYHLAPERSQQMVPRYFILQDLGEPDFLSCQIFSFTSIENLEDLIIRERQTGFFIPSALPSSILIKEIATGVADFFALRPLRAKRVPKWLRTEKALVAHLSVGGLRYSYEQMIRSHIYSAPIPGPLRDRLQVMAEATKWDL